MKQLETWLFLVSANPYLDYRTVIAPDFLCKAKRTSLLARNAGGDLTSHKISYVEDSQIGSLTLVFRVIEAIAEDLGVEGNGVLKDSFGRKIYLIKGLVFKGKLSNIQLTEQDFENLHNEIKNYYPAFWKSTTSQPATPSKSQEFNSEMDIQFIEEIKEPTENINLKIDNDSTKQEKKMEYSQTRKYWLSYHYC
ncbi:hypothetical protein VKI22_03515 [Cyanobacterium aponinum UTEX 3221]|uniref:hypothetical protein n=1 Tax=Cyanobacterium aponinum TaxID=379064 RepID=UPI002B4BA73B|nr:hypothetical protein [Cyanobacterium aponinum]WRL39179.1 hypothetical protein VKI22_03515 [Cyanobacterium aponinum UTEX 3221]